MFNGNTLILRHHEIKTKGREALHAAAHEIGHGVLGDPLDTVRFHNSEYDSDDPRETACNVFARDLLAPACVLAALNIHTPDEIMKVCDISRTSAEIRADRMKLLYERGKFGRLILLSVRRSSSLRDLSKNAQIEKNKGMEEQLK